MIELSEDTKILVSVLKAVEVGQVVTYAELSKSIGVADVRNEKTYGYLQTARRCVQRDFRMVFDTVRGEGLRRLDDSGKVVVVNSFNQRASRIASKGLKVVAAIDEVNLSPDERKKLYAESAMLGAVKMFSGKQAKKKLEAVQKAEPVRLSMAKTLELFGGQ